MLSTISILVIFVGYFLLGCVFNVAVEQWQVVDSIYFWIVTFTTVGLGDQNYTLKTNIDYLSILVVYRIFGLALLAGAIDSLVAWMNMRKELFKLDAQKMKEISLRRFSSNIFGSVVIHAKDSDEEDSVFDEGSKEEVKCLDTKHLYKSSQNIWL